MNYFYPHDLKQSQKGKLLSLKCYSTYNHGLDWDMKKYIAGEHGFSLIELVVIVVLLGVLSIAAVPSMFDLTGFQARGFYDEVVSAVRHGQRMAVSSGCDVQIAITSAGYSLYQRANCDATSPFTISVEHPSGSGPFSGTTPNGLVVSSATIIFDPMGRALNSVKVVTDYLNVGIGTLTFDVIGETGYVNTQ